MPSLLNPYDTQEVHFLDGPWKGTRDIIRSHVEEGHVIKSRVFSGDAEDYRLQWNHHLFRWEAITIQTFKGDETASIEE